MVHPIGFVGPSHETENSWSYDTILGERFGATGCLILSLF
jgi:hypothetical protein